MLWRVRQAFRHFQRAAAIHPGRLPPPHLLILLTLSRAQWASLAVASRPIHHPPPSNSPTPNAGNVNTLLPPTPPLQPQPKRRYTTPEIPSHARTVDALYTLFLDEKLGQELVEGEYRDILLLLKDPGKARELAVAMVSTPLPQRSCHVARLAHHVGCKYKQSLFESIAHASAMAQRWSLVPQIVALGMQLSGRTTTRLLNWRLRALMELGDFNQLEAAVADFAVFDLRLNRMTFHLLISAHLRNRDLPKAKEYLFKMTVAGFAVDASTHALLVSVYRSLGLDHEAVKRALQSLDNLDGHTGTAVLNSLIRMLLDKGDLDGALRYMFLLCGTDGEYGHHQVDGVASIPHGDDFRDQLHSNPMLSPDIATYTMLVECFGRTNRLPDIAQVLQHMQSVKIQPDETFVEVLIRAYAAAGNISAALSVVSGICFQVPAALPLLRQIGAEPTSWAVPKFLASTVRPTARILNALLQIALQTHGFQGMQLVAGVMDVCRVKVDETFVESVLAYMSKTAGSRPWQLIMALRKLRKAIPVTLRHAVLILSAIVRMESKTARRGAWFAALAKHRHHRRFIASPTVLPERSSSLSDLFDPLAGMSLPRRPAYLNLFRPIIEDLLSRSIKSDKATFALRIRHDAIVKRDLMLAEQSFQRMMDSGLHANRYHYTALLEGYAQAGDIASARRVMQASADAGFPPDLVMYTILLIGYAYQGSPILAARTFQKMVASGIRPDGKAIAILANAFWAVGDDSTAKGVLLDMWHFVCPRPQEITAQVKYRTLLRVFEAAVATSGGRPMNSQHRRAASWKASMFMWRVIIPRLQRANPRITWAKRTQVATGKKQRKLARRRSRKQRDVLDSDSQYTNATSG